MWKSYYTNYEQNKFAQYTKIGPWWMLRTKSGPYLAFHSESEVIAYINKSMKWWALWDI